MDRNAPTPTEIDLVSSRVHVWIPTQLFRSTMRTAILIMFILIMIGIVTITVLLVIIIIKAITTVIIFIFCILRTYVKLHIQG